MMVPEPIAIPTEAAASACFVDPFAHHGHQPAFGDELLDPLQLLGRGGARLRPCNVIVDNGGFGIHLTATSSINTVRRNDLEGNALGSIHDAGTGNSVTS